MAKKCKCIEENECGNIRECTKKEKCVRCGREYKICRMRNQNNPQETQKYGTRFYCEECDFLNRGEIAGQEYMASLIGKEVDEGVFLTPSNMREAFKRGMI